MAEKPKQRDEQGKAKDWQVPMDMEEAKAAQYPERREGAPHPHAGERPNNARKLAHQSDRSG